MTSLQSLAVGLIGAGRMGAFHAETLARRLPGVRLAAIADAAPGTAQALAARLDCPKAYTEIGDLLTDPEIEAVVIVTPAHTHAALDDVRGEVLGSNCMLTMGDLRRTHLTAYGPAGASAECVTHDQDLRHAAYVAELAEFTDSVRDKRTPSVTGEDARAALGIALAAIGSIATGRAVRVGDVRESPATVVPAAR
ncbi:Gfo/Idh/MocA family protein [Streptomyces cavernae]|uniref:Gfo/Idh/MocA family protein n=1 Tax=Streptomyces cavernae TaxID=2259034 RepID=UPI000FEB82AB|nr:Gfo/Idh/MocA family oxidoreductase [Streptomyces cavernae]